MTSFELMMGHIAAAGHLRPNRTSVPSVAEFGHSLQYDLRQGFPLISSKYVNFQNVIAELVGFLRGVTSAADFRELGTKIWDSDANVNAAWLANPHRKGTDDLGRIYGKQWREWESVKLLRTGDHNYAARRDGFLATGYEMLGVLTYDGGGLAVMRKHIDQLQELIDGIQRDPYGRRHLVTAWNPGELNEMALPPCHTFFQCYVEGDYLDMQMYQRSADLFLGVPYNIASYAALLTVIARQTGKTPRKLRMLFGDTHVYTNHIDQVALQMQRRPYPLPQLTLLDADSLDDYTVEHFKLDGYEGNHHPAIRAPMAQQLQPIAK